MKQQRAILYTDKTVNGEINYCYVSTKKSRRFTSSAAKESSHGKVIRICFKRRKFFNIFKNDYKYVVFILPVKQQFSEGTSFGTLGGKKEGPFVRRWFEIRDDKKHTFRTLSSYITNKEGNLSILSIKRVRNKKLAKALEQTYNSIF